jgi:hypothetical protein
MSVGRHSAALLPWWIGAAGSADQEEMPRGDAGDPMTQLKLRGGQARKLSTRERMQKSLLTALSATTRWSRELPAS